MELWILTTVYQLKTSNFSKVSRKPFIKSLMNDFYDPLKKNNAVRLILLLSLNSMRTTGKKLSWDSQFQDFIYSLVTHTIIAVKRRTFLTQLNV